MIGVLFSVYDVKNDGVQQKEDLYFRKVGAVAVQKHFVRFCDKLYQMGTVLTKMSSWTALKRDKERNKAKYREKKTKIFWELNYEDLEFQE